MPDDTRKPADTAPCEAVEAGAGTAPDGGGRNAAKPLPDPGRNRAGRYPRFSRVALMDLRAWVDPMFLGIGHVHTGDRLGGVTDEDLAKAGGANLDLWTGVGMIAFAAAFAAWLVLRPPEVGEAKIGDPEDDVDYMFLPIEGRDDADE